MCELIPSVDTLHLDDVAEAKPWIWEGYLAKGHITLFTSVWKSGKTTLLAHLLAQRHRAGTLVGQAVAGGATAVVSEESVSYWRDRNTKLGFGPRDLFYCRPFSATPTHEQWSAFIDQLAAQGRTEGIDLVVIDPLAHFLPKGEENHGALLMDALLPLRRLADAGQAVLLLHHPRKAPSPEGMAARGSGVLPAFVDVSMEMYPFVAGNAADRRRRLLGFSRDPATPRSLLIELSADGSAFTTLAPPPEDDAFGQTWAAIHLVLSNANRELTRDEILAQWPGTTRPPKSSALWSWLATALERNLVARVGAGVRADPCRYFLPEKMAVWKKDPMYDLAQKFREADMMVLFPPSYDISEPRGK